MKIYREIKNYLRKSPLFSFFFQKLKWIKYENDKRLKDEEFATRFYKKVTGKILNIDEPKTFDDKLWYLKLNNRNPLLTKCTDKYLVREYVEECGLGHILNDLYGVYDDARDIDFDNLPDDKVFLKCNHTSGYNAIYDKNNPFDRDKFIKKFNFILGKNHYWLSREWNYKDIKPKIICERMLPQTIKRNENDFEGLIDYRFLCSEGKAEYIFVDIDTCDVDGSHNIDALRNVYDKNFNYIDVKVSRNQFDPKKVKKPDNFDEMKNYAEILSSPFPFCRVDLYNINGKIFFGEITFYHAAGCNIIEPMEWDLKLGDLINIESSKIVY